MQIGWMEDDSRNLTAKVWANLDNPIKRYDFSKVSLILCMSPSQVALFWYMWCHNSTTVSWNCTQMFTTFYFSWKCVFPLLWYLGMLGLRWMCMHLCMNLIKRTIDSQERKKLWKSMYKINGELSSWDITYSARVPSREGDIHNFA